MSDTNKLVATPRDNFGKGAARKLRAVGQTPAVVYGHGTDPVHISVDAHALGLIVRYANALIELDLADGKQLVLVKDVQKDPVRQIIEHVDLIVVNQGETVEASVPVHVVGEPFSGNSALQELNSIRLSVPATAIPEAIEVNVEGLQGGTQVLAGAVELPEGAILLEAEDQLVVNIVAPRGGSDDDASEDAAE